MSDEFSRHQIKQTVEADGFASWLILRVHEDGGWDQTFWARITAAEGHLRVSGDFDPVAFAHGPLDPRACVAWMGSHNGLDHYVTEKASIGTGGRDRISRWDTDAAVDDLRAALAEAKEQREDDDDTVERAIQAGLDTSPEYDGIHGCFEIQRAVFDADGNVSEYIALGSIGRRPSWGLVFAHRAVRRLHELLEAKAISKSASRQIAAEELDPTDRDRLHKILVMLADGHAVAVRHVYAVLWPGRARQTQNKALCRLIKKVNAGTNVRLRIIGAKRSGDAREIRATIARTRPTATEMGVASADELDAAPQLRGVPL